MSWTKKVEEESPTPSLTSWKPRSKWAHPKITLISSTTKTQLTTSLPSQPQPELTNLWAKEHKVMKKKHKIWIC
jgi:hypothetical protein